MASSQRNVSVCPFDSKKTQNVYAIEPKKRNKRKMPMPRKSDKSKSLRFSEYSSLVLTEPYSSEDRRNAWYQAREIEAFKKRALHTSQVLQKTRTAKLMKHIAKSAATGTPQANITPYSKEVIRGLEHLIAPQVSCLLLSKRRKTIAGVLRVQHQQRISGIGANPLIIAKVSEMNSAFSKEWCSRITHLQDV